MSDHPIEPELLDAFLDGELEAGEEQRVRTHVEACGECRSYVQRVRGFKETFSAMPRFPAPPALVRKIKQQPSIQSRSWWLSRPFLAAVSVAAALVVVSAVAVYESGRDVSFVAEPSAPSVSTRRAGRLEEEEKQEILAPAPAEEEPPGREAEPPEPEKPSYDREPSAREAAARPRERKALMDKAGAGLAKAEAAKTAESLRLKTAPAPEPARHSAERSGEPPPVPEPAADSIRAQALEAERDPPPAPETESEANAFESLAGARETPGEASPPSASRSLAEGKDQAPPAEAPEPPRSTAGKAAGDEGFAAPPLPERLNVLAEMTASSPEQATRLALRKADELGWSVSEVRPGDESILFVLVPLENRELPSTSPAAVAPEQPEARRRTVTVEKGAEGARRGRADAALAEETAGAPLAAQAEQQPTPDATGPDKPDEERTRMVHQQAFTPVVNVIEVRIKPDQTENAGAGASEK